MPSQHLSENLEQEKHLDLHTLEEVPETHAWTSSDPDDHPFAAALADDAENVPVIDLNDENAPDLIGHACKAWGVFQVLSHGVPKKLLDRIESATNHLFSLPMHRKELAARRADDVSGYGPARISCFFEKRMWSEGYTIAASPNHHARQLFPHDHQNFCDTIEEYQEAMKGLAGRLMWAMVGWLGAEKEEVKWAESGCSALQMNCYPRCPEPGRAMGLAAHTDSTLVTVLHQSSGCGGLQVRREGARGRWTAVPPVPGALVVHVGDLLHMLSNGEYPSVLHRAVVSRAEERVSVAYLYGPPPGVKISPLSRLVDQHHPPLYGPITWAHYLAKKNQLFNKALASLRASVPAPSPDVIASNNNHHQ